MKTEQLRWSSDGAWEPQSPGGLGSSAQLVLVFGGTELMKNGELLGQIKQAYPQALHVGCSTAGEIQGTEVNDDTLVVTAVQFGSTSVKGAVAHIDDAEQSRQVGRQLSQSLDKEGLRHLFVLSDGLKVNGSDLVAGLYEDLPPDVTVTGGLSGDGANFKETLVLYDGEAVADQVVAVGLYGAGLRVGYASLGGWDPFGPERVVTRSQGNVLFELDGSSALELYKKYLGEHASGLPATGLLFPLAIRPKDGGKPVVRTILAVDEEAQSMTFAGDVPEGSYAQLMKANFDRLVDGASGAAKASQEGGSGKPAELGILISCVGRKLVLKQRIEEEVEAVRDVLGEQATLTGFYSYGEISPFTPGAKCELHNQTMTITTLAEG